MNSTLEKAPTILTAAGARKLTESIRRKLEDADAELLRAWEGRVWEALDLPDWSTWCAQSFPELSAIRLAVPERRERARVLRLVGAPVRDIAAATGVSPASVQADLNALRDAGQLDDEPATTRGRDGRSRPATGMQARQQAQVERHGLTILMHEAWQRVAGCADAGMTCLELEKKARWRHGRASSLLHRLERAGLVERTGVFREDYGVYVARPLD